MKVVVQLVALMVEDFKAMHLSELYIVTFQQKSRRKAG